MRGSDSKAFRTMWSAFTWENKISVNTNLNSLAGSEEEEKGVGLWGMESMNRFEVCAHS